MNKIYLEQEYRITCIFFIFIFLYATLTCYLYILQIKNGAFYKNLADNQYYGTLTILPPREEIVDRNNNPLSINVDSISAFITPNNIKNKNSLKEYLQKEFPAAYNRLESNNNFNFLYIKRKLSEKELQDIIDSKQDIKLLKEPNRYYTNETLSSVVGVTNIDNEGINGLEYMYNNQLIGKPLNYILSKDAKLGFFTLENKYENKNNTVPLKTTLDSNLQFLIYEELKEAVNKLESKQGSVLVLNPENGEILAMVNYPTFNPNDSYDLENDYSKNYTVSDAYELGSVIKVFLAMAALEENVVNIDELIDCENTLTTTLNGITFGTTKAHGILPFRDVVSLSNNIGMAKVALRLGNKIYDHYKKLGFGQKIGILPGENSGILIPPAKWSKASPISLSFGYEVSLSLLQLAQAVTIIANNGYLVVPKIIIDNKEPVKIGPLYNSKTINSIKDILKNTAIKAIRNKNYFLNGFSIMGKTGTARLLTDGQYDPNKNIFTFAAIVEKNNYKRIVITFIKETKLKNVLAYHIAVPLFEKILEKMIILEKIL